MHYAGFGGGSYKMTSVKMMKASSAFLICRMKAAECGCKVEVFQDCRIRRLLEACSCVPWEVQESFGRNKYFSDLKRISMGAVPNFQRQRLY